MQNQCDRPLGASFRHNLGGLDRRAQTQGVFESVAVDAGSDLLTCSLEEKMLSLLAVSCDTDLVQESKLEKV